jgi:hypothetical protein
MQEELTPHERRRIEVLQKRATFLKSRIEASPNKDLSYDKAELSALTWEIARITGSGEDRSADDTRKGLDA